MNKFARNWQEVNGAIRLAVVWMTTGCKLLRVNTDKFKLPLTYFTPDIDRITRDEAEVSTTSWSEYTQLLAFRRVRLTTDRCRTPHNAGNLRVKTEGADHRICLEVANQYFRHNLSTDLPKSQEWETTSARRRSSSQGDTFSIWRGIEII